LVIHTVSIRQVVNQYQALTSGNSRPLRKARNAGRFSWP
jgi:hypothetical protein